MGIVAICLGIGPVTPRMLAGAALAMILLAGSSAAECAHAPLAELPMVPNDDGTPVVSLKIDGTPRDVLLDTGGFWSLIDPAIARDYFHHRARIVGQLGLQGIPLTRAIMVPSLEIGGEV